MRRYVLTVVMGIALASLSAGAALAGGAMAGGWATAELDEPLPEFAPGGTWLIGFTILQHGTHPAAVDGAGLRFTNKDAGEVMFFEAGPQGAEGHYVASVARLSAGTWSLEVAQGSLLQGRDGAPSGLHFAPYPIGTITVAAATPVVGAASNLSPVEPIAASEAGVSPFLIAALVAAALASIGVGYGIIRHRDGAAAKDGVEYAGHTEEGAV